MRKINIVIVVLIGASLIFIANINPSLDRFSEYSVVKVCNMGKLERLEKEVNLKIKDGWQPVGGINSWDACYMQSMAR